MARFRRGMGLRPIQSTKHIVEVSSVAGASTNAVALTIIKGVDNPVLANANEVQPGHKVSSIFLSVFYIAEGGELATEVPLVDWYIIHNPGNVFAAVFDAANNPTPGTTGIHLNKRHIFHTEKGLAGGGDVSLAGLPMIFKGVIKIPRGRQRVGQNDRITINHRTNFATKFCIQAIYKDYG